ncbi:hypothetical protein GQ602_003733 [Ophiocordyceps camponoti-floridani]|uniref:Uncharacterized protein n=1 Tax=Ophiocordyceps camponoti-floridani TaxID=2030778 RepID=A0A8H4VEJ1_9HYPO|nr:hypothetical protein GQ602_003733 [Ophiocordyceps camponoti-floridani]
MQTFLTLLVSALAGLSLGQQQVEEANARNCPTVTATKSVCSTCIRAMCVIQKTVTCQRGCQTPLPTVYKSFPCGSPCPGGCGTFYTYKGCGKSTPTPAPKL